MKKVLIFSLAYYPHVGGAEIAIKEITGLLTDIEWHLVTLRFSKDDKAVEKVGNVLVHRIGSGTSYLSKILFIPNAALKAVALHRQEKFDALWAMMLYMTFPITLARMFGVRVPYVLTLQEGDPYEHVFERWYIKVFSPLLKSGFKNASVIQTISTYLAEWAKQQHYSGPIVVVPNGVDTASFVGERVPHNGVVLITTSRLVHKNAVDVVIKALKLLPDTVTFTILGVGTEEAALRALAKKEGVESRVEFVGHIDHKDMPAYLHAADIFIRPSRSEGMGNSFIEAFAAGLPVIATQEGGIADFLFDAKRNPGLPTTGFAVDVDSPEQIVQVVKYICANPEQVAAVTAEAKKLALSRYDWNTIAREMHEKVFTQVI